MYPHLCRSFTGNVPASVGRVCLFVIAQKMLRHIGQVELLLVLNHLYWKESIKVIIGIYHIIAILYTYSNKCIPCFREIIGLVLSFPAVALHRKSDRPRQRYNNFCKHTNILQANPSPSYDYMAISRLQMVRIPIANHESSGYHHQVWWQNCCVISQPPPN